MYIILLYQSFPPLGVDVILWEWTSCSCLAVKRVMATSKEVIFGFPKSWEYTQIVQN